MKSNRIVIVQCRLSSTRLPGKALITLKGKTVLGWALSAMKKVSANYYYVATDTASYDRILPICNEYGFSCFAGSPDDVLKRFCDLLKETGDAQTVIRATADNPFLFYEAAEESVEEFERINDSGEGCDYLTYSGLPHGSGVEVFSAASIMKAIKETEDAYDHEHVGPALYNHKDRYICKFINAPEKYNHPDLRTTIDTYPDYLRACNIASFINKEAPYTAEDIVGACNSYKVKNPVILVPSVKKGQGTGHLHRCLALALKNKYFVYIPDDKTLEECDSLVDLYIKDGLDKSLIINKLPDESYKPVFVTDSFKLTRDDYNLLKVNNGIISIDEGSDYSQCSDYLLDIIPSYCLNRLANKTDFNLIEKPLHIRDKALQEGCKGHRESIKNILVCLGGEDPAGFTVPVTDVLKEYFYNAHITAVMGTNNNLVDTGSDNVSFAGHIPALKEELYKYDLVVTHYGLTAFEACGAGCGVILLPTTELHKNLAELYKFAYIPDNVFTVENVEKAFLSDNLYKNIESGSGEKLNNVIEHIAAGRKMTCPICQADDTSSDNIVSRNSTRTYRRCSKCGIVYMSYTIQPEMCYGKNYFFEDYKKQYGKTYEEDFDFIKSQGCRRIDNIKEVCKSVDNKLLLDIGCAYGPFLAAARDYNIIPYGTDISKDAVDYVCNRLNYNAKCCAFPDIDTEKEFNIRQFDIVSMWYVIEHFKNLDIVLGKVNKILKAGGIFAFSTPCGEGISAKSDINLFYERSPADHYTIWEITRAGQILQKYGFAVEKIVSTGHHPERFPVIKEKQAVKGDKLWNEIDKMSHEKQLGDTVEIYCRKIR